jgi:O-antigen ligase
VVLAFWSVLCIGAARRVVERIALAVATAIAVAVLSSAGAVLGLAAGFVAFALAWIAPRLTAAALALGLVVLAAGLPLAVPSYGTTVALREHGTPIKWDGLHRLLIWRFTADRIAERPVLGWGMDASRAMPGGKTRFADLFPDAQLPGDAEALPLHPHDAALQWELELGVPGTVLCLAIVAWGLWRVTEAEHVPRLARASGLAWAASALVIALLDYGAWQAWWFACLFLGAAIASATGTPADSAGSPAPHLP